MLFCKLLVLSNEHEKGGIEGLLVVLALFWKSRSSGTSKDIKSLLTDYYYSDQWQNYVLSVITKHFAVVNTASI